MSSGSWIICNRDETASSKYHQLLGAKINYKESLQAIAWLWIQQCRFQSLYIRIKCQNSLGKIKIPNTREMVNIAQFLRHISHKVKNYASFTLWRMSSTVRVAIILKITRILFPFLPLNFVVLLRLLAFLPILFPFPSRFTLFSFSLFPFSFYSLPYSFLLFSVFSVIFVLLLLVVFLFVLLFICLFFHLVIVLPLLYVLVLVFFLILLFILFQELYSIPL